MNLIKTFVHNPVKVTVGVILLLMFGILAMLSMPMQLTPEVQVPTLTIQTTWPGASPQEVEREIIQEQEEHLKSVEGVRKISSESMDSMGQVTLEFPVGTDMREALLKVNTKLAQVPSYPEDANEPVINTSNAADRPIAWFILGERVPSHEEGTAFAAKHPELKQELDLVYAARSDGLKMHRLQKLAEQDVRVRNWLPPPKDISTFRKFAEDYIEAGLERVEGVSNANVLGGREEELQLYIDPEKLAARNLTINQVRLALRAQNEDTSAGDYWEGKRRYVVRTLGRFRSPEQVENAIVARREGGPVYVHDVGRVVEGHKKPDGFVKRFGTTCIAINAQRAVGANVLDVMTGLRNSVQELNVGVLQQNQLQLVQVYDETEYIYSAVNLVSYNLIYGAWAGYGTDGSGVNSQWGLWYNNNCTSQANVSLPDPPLATPYLFLFDPGNTNWQSYIFGKEQNAVRAYHLRQCVDDPIDERGTLRSRNQVHEHFGVGRGLEDRSVFFQTTARFLRVDEVAVVADGEASE